jgi:tRNA (guanine9-N1)-methyltransferase
MSDAAYKRWVNTEWWHEGYEQLWQTRPEGEAHSITESDLDKGIFQQPLTLENESGTETQTALQQNVIYLTADSEEELTELKPEEIYIIGGICDHNRYKVALLH